MTYRHFSKQAEDCARRWAADPVEHGWTIGAAIGKRHSTSPNWACKGNLTAVLKPGPGAMIDAIEHDPLSDIFQHSHAHYVARTPIAAIERIAADLAFRLGLPVPPVALFENTDLPQGAANRLACLSLKPFDGDVAPAKSVIPSLTRDQIEQFIATDSAMAVFKTWLQNTDLSPSNIVMERKAGKPAYPDFSVSSLAHWAMGKPATSPLVLETGLFSRSDLRIAQDLVAALPEKDIRETISAVPARFLDDSLKTIMADGLLHRQKNIGQLTKKSAAVMLFDTAGDAASFVITRRRFSTPSPDLDP